MTRSRHTSQPSKVLGEIQMMIAAEAAAHPHDMFISVDRRHLLILQVALGELIGQIEVLEQEAVVADRLTEEMRILQADRERWRTAAETYRNAWGREIDRTERPRLVRREAEVVDLVEVLRRECRDAAHSAGPEGGAA